MVFAPRSPHTVHGVSVCLLPVPKHGHVMPVNVSGVTVVPVSIPGVTVMMVMTAVTDGRRRCGLPIRAQRDAGHGECYGEGQYPSTHPCGAFFPLRSTSADLDSWFDSSLNEL